MDREGAKEKQLPEALRVEGKYYVIDELIEKIDVIPSAPTSMAKLFSMILFLIFYCSLGVMEQSPEGWAALFCSLLIHELGHVIGMFLVGWRKAGLVFIPPCIPLAVGDGISAGRKALVALSAPAVGLIVGLLALMISGGSGEQSFLQQMAQCLLFLSAINLVPIKPFDGGAAVEHLVLVRFPKLELGYLIASGIILFLFIYTHYISTDRYVLGMVSFAICLAQFMGAKKADNMASMISMIRNKGQDDLERGRYSINVKGMTFFLDAFELPNEASITMLLREAWDRAREVPATWRDICMVSVGYVLLIVVCFQNQLIKEMFGLLR